MVNNQDNNEENNKTRTELLFNLLIKKNFIIKKYRKKFEELKISQIRNKIEDGKSKNE